MKIRNKRKRKQKIGDYRWRVRKKLRVYYLFHVLLLAAYLLLCGVFYVKNGSERRWHGESEPLIGVSEVINWIEEKWDLFLDEIGDKIKP